MQRARAFKVKAEEVNTKVGAVPYLWQGLLR
jgi:hypothetical protein